MKWEATYGTIRCIVLCCNSCHFVRDLYRWTDTGYRFFCFSGKKPEKGKIKRMMEQRGDTTRQKSGIRRDIRKAFERILISTEDGKIRYENYRKHAYLRILQSRHIRNSDRVQKKKVIIPPYRKSSVHPVERRWNWPVSRWSVSTAEVWSEASFTTGRRKDLRYMSE